MPFVEVHRPQVDAPDLEQQLVSGQSCLPLGLLQKRAADALRAPGCVDPEEISAIASTSSWSQA